KDLAERIKTLNPNIKVLFMSGYTANFIAHHGVLDQGVHFIAKPFSIKTLSTKIRKVLDQKL
ncbi:MAG: hybrid sensor histidine kinase/response regulator, partial [Desulfobacteraceae bacterium]